jgi:hypothetical protein
MASDSAKSHWWNDPAKRAAAGAVLAAVPVALVNSVAFIGQFAYLNANVPWPVIARVLIAVTVESIAIYLAWHAHLAKMANDTALRLVLGAYSVALLIATVNYSHFAHDWHPTPLAVIMGLASLISPFLWGVHTKRASRDKLMDRGLVEEHSVRLGGSRWTLHPLRSARATSWASWHGVNDPKTVLAHFAPRYGTPDTPAPARKSRAVPAGTLQAVPAAQTVPAITAPAAPAGPVAPSPGTVVNGVPVPGPAVHQAEVSLEAHGSLAGGGKRPPLDVIEAAELRLAGMPVEQLRDKARWVARELLHDKNQRRLAAKLIADRLRAEPVRAGMDQAPDNAGVNGMTAPVHGGGSVG